MANKTLEIQCDQISLNLAAHITKDVSEHLADIIESWAQRARAKHPTLTDEEILALPNIAEQEAAREQERIAEQLAYEQRKQAIDAVIESAPQSQRAFMRQQLSEADVTLEQANKKLAEAVIAEQERLAQAAEQAAARKAEFIEMLQDPELLAAAAAAQGKKVEPLSEPQKL